MIHRKARKGREEDNKKDFERETGNCFCALALFCGYSLFVFASFARFAVDY
jgi:hypothetical protein